MALPSASEIRRPLKEYLFCRREWPSSCQGKPPRSRVPRYGPSLDFHRAQIPSQTIKKISSNRPLFFNSKGGVLPGSRILECIEEFAPPCTAYPPRLRDPPLLSLRMAIRGAGISAEASGPSFFIAQNGHPRCRETCLAMKRKARGE